MATMVTAKFMSPEEYWRTPLRDLWAIGEALAEDEGASMVDVSGFGI